MPPASHHRWVVEIQPNTKIHIAVTEAEYDDGALVDKPALVFLHYWGGSTRTWAQVAALMSGKSGYSTVALDFRGWGESTGPSDPRAYSISQLADDVETVIRDHLQLNSAVLVGLSMGAKVAQAIAGRGRLAEHLKGVVLVSPAPPTPLMLPQEASEQQIHAYDSWQNADFVARNILISRPDALSDETLKQVVADMLRGNEHARAAWPSYAIAEDITELAEKIRAPVLVVAGGQDSVEPLDRVKKEVCGRIPGSELAVISSSGHLSPLEAPNEVAHHVLEFLSKIQHPK